MFVHLMVTYMMVVRSRMAQAPFVQRADNFIQRISRYPADKMDWLEYIAIYPLDRGTVFLNNPGQVYRCDKQANSTASANTIVSTR